MKCTIFFSIFCLVTVSRGHDRSYWVVEECVQELNIQPVNKYDKPFSKEDYLKNADEFFCMRACTLRKMFNTTVYRGLMQIVNEIEKVPVSYKFTREDVIAKLNDCFKKEPEECKFFKCIDPLNGPVAEWLN